MRELSKLGGDGGAVLFNVCFTTRGSGTLVPWPSASNSTRPVQDYPWPDPHFSRQAELVCDGVHRWSPARLWGAENPDSGTLHTLSMGMRSRMNSIDVYQPLAIDRAEHVCDANMNPLKFRHWTHVANTPNCI